MILQPIRIIGVDHSGAVTGLRYKRESGGQNAVFSWKPHPLIYRKWGETFNLCWRLSQEPSLCWCWAEETVKRSPSFHGTGCIATFPTEGFSHRVRLHQSPEPLSVKGVYSLCLGTQTILLDKDSLTNLYTLGKSDGCGFACLLPWGTYHKENILESEKNSPGAPFFLALTVKREAVRSRVLGSSAPSYELVSTGLLR